MKTNYYSLGSIENNRLVKIIQIFFGLACIIIAIYWLISNMKSVKSDNTLWITIVFLTGFGIFQIMSGTGRTVRFIEIQKDCIRLKKNSILPSELISASKINKIDFYPLSVAFYFKSGKKNLLRFGTLYQETNEKIVDDLVAFAESNNIPFDIIEEKL